MITIKKYLYFIILGLTLSITACSSKDNQESSTTNMSIEQSKQVTQNIVETTESNEAQVEATSTDETQKGETKINESEATQKKITESTEESEQKSVDSNLIESSTNSVENNIPNSETVENETTTNQNITSNEDNTKISWSFKRNQEHKPVIGYNEGVDLEKFNSCYLGDTSKKEIYLTFDEGYEYGYSASILDTLKANNVKATFFLTKDFIETEPELCKRMAQEGHTVGNHSVTHPSFPSLTDEELVYEIEETARYYKEVTGYEMDKFLRPPKGEFSARTLDITKQLNYKTIFWSLAYVDWNVDNQPGKEAAYKHVMDNYHNGGIFLLHAVSQSNAKALDDIIKSLKSEGYTLLPLNDLH